MQRVTILPAGDLSALGQRWQALESRTAPGFFRSWTFLGCLAKQRFAGAHLLAVTQDGHDVALALLGGTRGRRWLNQTGNAVHDLVFIEHNGLLAIPKAAASLATFLRTARGRGRLVLSGIDDATMLAAKDAGWLHLEQSRWAPCVQLDAMPAPYLDTLSPNARAQIRRSCRLYGPDLQLSCAETLVQALGDFDEMVGLHQTAWQRRGRPGAFAHPDMRAFHQALIARAWPQKQAELLRITAGARHVGTLYSLIRDGRVHSYQSGFAYGDDAREKPGLVCHALAIEHYAARGARVYDLLAGADRYKMTLAQDGQMLHWATLHSPWSAAGLVRLAADQARHGLQAIARQAATLPAK